MRSRKFFKKRREPVNTIIVGIIFFFLAMIVFIIYTNWQLIPKQSYYTQMLDSTLPIIYQEREGKKINELRAYKGEEYKLTANETLTMLEEDRVLNLYIKNNSSFFDYLEYEVRDKTSNKLIERTKLDIIDSKRNLKEDTTRVTLNIQNLILQNTTYLLTIRINLGERQVYYFANIIYKQKNNLDEALAQVEDFTLKTFDKEKAAELVKYFETSINSDTREMYDVNLQHTFDQLTFVETDMKLVSELYYNVYQAQEYSYSIVINYLSKSGNNKKNELFVNRDEYVLRWDGTRWYYMKFNRKTEELIDLSNRPYDEEKNRFYMGVTDPDNFVKIESNNKNYFAFCKQKEVYLYDVLNKTMTNIFSYRVEDADSFEKTSRNYDVKIMDVSDEGVVKYIVYGYNMTGANEGYNGIGIYNYDPLLNISEELLFVPIYTSYQSLRYDIDKLCVLKNNRLIFKSYNKVFSIDINTAEIVTLAEDFEETKFAASDNSRYFAFNNDKEGEVSKHINIYNIDEGKVMTISAKENENIEVVTFMNDDLFYSVYSEENIWREAGKIIGRPSHEIRVINAVTGVENVFKEKDRYLYNFVNQKNVLRYNKYTREGTHYTFLSNDVIVNNYSIENTDTFHYQEEFTKEKLRIGYIEIPMEENERIRYQKNAGISRKPIEDAAIESIKEDEETLYYVYDSGVLKAKLKILSDGINEIRDNYGYVKLNDIITCYNRANKGNVSYLRQEDSILENIKGFEENIYLKDNKILVMNVTGVTERDLEYYISLNEKVAAFKNDMFQFFITGYDNNNYVLEYSNGERILTPRNEVREAVVNGGYVLFAQLESLE